MSSSFSTYSKRTGNRKNVCGAMLAPDDAQKILPHGSKFIGSGTINGNQIRLVLQPSHSGYAPTRYNSKGVYYLKLDPAQITDNGSALNEYSDIYLNKLRLEILDGQLCLVSGPETERGLTRKRKASSKVTVQPAKAPVSPSPGPIPGGLTIPEAKRGLAATFGVPESAIEIVIRS
jgi:hypothetical protein